MRSVLHLDLGLGVGLQVLVPGRVLGGAALGGHDHPVVAVGALDQGRRAGLAGAAPAGAEQQDLGAPPAIAALAAGLPVDADVLGARTARRRGSRSRKAMVQRPSRRQSGPLCWTMAPPADKQHL